MISSSNSNDAEGAWEHHTIHVIRGDDKSLGFMFEDRCWCWIPRPPIPVKVGDRISIYRCQPDGYTVRCVIGEMEVATFYSLHRAGIEY